MTLFLQYFRAQLRGLLLWSFFIGLLVFALAQNAPSLTADGSLEKLMAQMPPAIQNMMGNPVGLTPIDGFITLELGLWLSLLFSLYGVMLTLGIVTREVDRRTIDFLLSLPVDRRQVMLGRIGVVVLNTALVALFSWLILYGSLTGGDHGADLGGYAKMILSQWLLAMALSGLCLFSSIWIDDFSFGVKAWMGGISTAMFLEFILRAVMTHRWVRFWSPFSYVDAPEILRAGLPAADIVILILLAVLGFGLSVPAFERKQITT